ncbi:MAG: DNA-protecting protein DprA [Ruminococcaceae bacterium]|nr:DNA-protecting protein DprA [Oscillospiraceae bacterium]
MLMHWIWLATLPGLHDRQKALLMQYFRDAEDVFFADADAYGCIEELSQEEREALGNKDTALAEDILRQCQRLKIHILTYRDAAYPSRLRNISDPPMVLYYKGVLPEFDSIPLIAVVGTRKASGYGLTTAKRMGSQIAECGGVVVSGMAFGIDGMAMRGALSKGAPVIGVLGSGADVVYPSSNRSLYADVEVNGCLLTEFAPGTPPMKWNFPKRNRIISGLCCGVLVVEAPEKSGALITARRAADQGRDVFVVPGNIDVASCKGSNGLLRDGAIAVSSGWEVVSEYAAQFPGKIRRVDGASMQTAYPDEVALAAREEEKTSLKVAQNTDFPRKAKKEKASKKKKEIDNSAAPLYSDAETMKPPLTETEQAIVNCLGPAYILVDDLIVASGLTAGTVSAALTMLQIKGVVKLLPGNRVQRNEK